MCELTKNLKAKSRIGYKVAVKKDGKYYSPSMGHEYKTGDVPIITEQKEISGYFDDEILTTCFRENMVGRSAAFVKKKDAKFLRDFIIIYSNDEIIILKVRLLKELMEGIYRININNYNRLVVAGKRMEILGEVG